MPDSISTKTSRRRSDALSQWGPAILVLVALGIYFSVDRPAAALTGWSDDYHASLAQAKSAERNLLLYFHSERCGPCNAMERTVLGEPEVVEALKDYVPVRVDAFRQTAIARRFGVFATPTYVVATPSEQMVTQASGYRSVEDFVSFLTLASAAMTEASASATIEPRPANRSLRN